MARAGNVQLFVPSRLLDVRCHRPYVVHTKDPAFETGRYTTLSHCWGDPDAMLKLTPSNMGDLTNPNVGIEWQSIPLSFQHAIQVTRQLGIRYIWIDSLCILQDGHEFIAEGQLMHYVYRNSFCNIAAADSQDGSGGLFRPRQPETVALNALSVEDTCVFPGTWYVIPAELWTSQLLSRVLYTRGWVFQGQLPVPSSTSRSNSVPREDALPKNYTLFC